MIVPLTGQRYSNKLTENCIAFWKAIGIYTDEEAKAVEKFLDIFKDKKFPQGHSILFTQSLWDHQRYKKRHSNIPAHVSPCFRVKEGDHVIIGQCRPISKTVRFNVLKVIPAGAAAGGKKAFAGI
ncbi:40S ribosomal protein S11-3-like isoform X4 [Chenopodium quinoa]|uniref:40S ribosomal protein S11-3-like isoform X4 n=1 Tax=Chenopodium quinoa TaxID=63459 RepID=UPI000B789876|nr:40S ribosomal protein S11-3-like isoform X4 [Chenopodium quinoa]XP_021725496.1 40S ribosomal protein S11-3-like isoform X4 [Chenopodium quinoa]